MALPSQLAIDRAISALSDVVDAMESHPLWTPPMPPKTLYFMWDFVSRSRHMLQTLPGTNPAMPPSSTALAAGARAIGSASAPGETPVQIWNDVKGRTVYAQVLIEDRSPKLSMMTGGGREAFDFGDEVRGKIKDAVDSFA